MFNRILIANRGEIALRVIRACRDLGIEAVAVYSRADADAAYLNLANDAVCIGAEAPQHSYLNPAAILSAAWALLGIPGLVAGAVCLAAVAALAVYFRVRLGGATGDTFGAACEIAEATVPLALILWPAYLVR